MWNELQREYRELLRLRRGTNGRWLEDRSRRVEDKSAEGLIRAMVENSGPAAYVTADHANASRFVAWLDRQGLALSQQDQKKAAEWRRGTRPRITVTVVDRIVTGFGRHLSELPDEVFE